MKKQHQKIRNKSELSNEVWERIKKVLKSRKISQVQLEKLCLDNGYRVKQPEISKLYSGSIQLTLYHLIAFSEALDIPVTKFLYEDGMISGFRLNRTAFASDPSDDIFKGYFGNYEIMLHSTSPFEEKLLFGRLTFTPNEKEKRCEARFYLDTGEKSPKGQPIYKKYEGILLISQKLSAGYVLLVNGQIGEINLIVFRHRNFLVKDLQCRMGMALTVAAGEARLPVAQKVFISRKKITDQMVKEISPFLRMEPSGEVIIGRADLKEWKKHVKDTEINIDEVDMNELVSISEMVVHYKNRKMNRGQLANLFASLKASASFPAYNGYLVSISEEEDNWTYELFKGIGDDA